MYYEKYKNIYVSIFFELRLQKFQNQVIYHQDLNVYKNYLSHFSFAPKNSVGNNFFY